MSDRTIRTTGHGRASRTPDIADVRLGIQVSRPTAHVARADAATTMQAVVDAVLAIGIAPGDIGTVALSLGPAWDYPADGQPRITGYQLTNQLKVTVRNVDRVAETLAQVVDAAIGAGATTLDGVEFRVAPPGSAEAAREALAGAVADARARAEALASEAALRITGVLSIEEGSNAASPPQPMFARMEAKAADTPVLAGSSEIEASVSVAFSAEPVDRAI